MNMFKEIGYQQLVLFFLVGIPVYFLITSLVKRVAINKIPKKITALALTILLTAVLSFAIIRTYYSMFKEEAGVAFNEQRWYNQPRKRYLMADSIVASNMLIGKDTSYIKGFFNDNRVFREGFISPDQQHIRTYDLGMAPSG